MRKMTGTDEHQGHRTGMCVCVRSPINGILHSFQPDMARSNIPIDIRPHHIDNEEGRLLFEWYAGAPKTDTVSDLFKSVRETFDLCPTDCLLLVSYWNNNKGHRSYTSTVDLYLNTTPFHHLVEKVYPNKFVLLWLPGYNIYYKNPQDLRYPLGYGGPSCPIPEGRLIAGLDSENDDSAEWEARVNALRSEDRRQSTENGSDGDERPSGKRARHE
jgi:hypothetical protein